MRSSLKSCIAVAAALLVAPSFASADDVGGGDDLQEVLSRMSDLEQQLKATNDALAASNARVDQQQQMLGKLETAKPSGPMLALSNFLTDTTFAGWVSSSYFYNTNNPTNGREIGDNAGTIGANPYHENHNSFQVDQVWFSMSNEATAESRAGFKIDILYGEAADQLATSFEANTLFDYLYNANVSYLAPITDAGIEITAGRFESHIGSEKVQDPYNFNITRGMLFTLQPRNFTGVTVASKYESGLDWMLGISNNSGYATLDSNIYAAFPNAQNYDTDEEKTFLWRVGYEISDTMSVAFNGLYGGNCATGDPTLSPIGGGCGATIGPSGSLDAASSDKQMLFDVTFNWDPSDRLSTWVNADYLDAIEEDRAGNPRIFGIAAAGRYAVTDTTGFALRLEYIKIWDNYLQIAANPLNLSTIVVDGPPIPLEGPRADQDLWSLTATVDHKLTDHLTVKAELVYQQGNAEDNNDEIFFCGDSCNASALEENQVLLGAQMTYEF